MKKMAIYLDTSIINFLFADDVPEQRERTQEFFDNYVRPGVYAIYISPIVIDEINRTPDERHKAKLLQTITTYPITILDTEPYTDDIQQLAQRYLAQQIVPRKKLEDALHIAISTIYEMDVLLSWNYRHLANIPKERKVMSVNMQEGYLKPLRITTPLEVMGDDREDFTSVA